MRIVIKKEACIGCELCVNLCPEVFMEWGLHMRPVITVDEPSRFSDQIRQAAQECPVRAITIETGPQ